MEWLAEAGKMAEWIWWILEWLKEATNVLGVSIFTASGILYAIWRGRRDKKRRVAALFEVPDERPGPDSAPSRFLREEFQIVDFYGREKEIEELTDWACRKIPPGKNVSIALVTGRPGRGKSRLARRLCKLAEEWNSGNWIAGFLKEDTGGENRDDFPLLMRKRKPVLAIVDHAEHRTEQVKKLVSAALVSDRRKHSVRILLTARTKNEGWWSGLENAFDGISTNPFEDGQVTLLELARIEKDPAVADRRQEFNRALRAFRGALGKKEEVEMPEDGILNDLMEMQEQEVEMLDIHVAALLAAYGDDGNDGGIGQGSAEEKLLGKLINQEQKFWDKDFKPLGLKGKSIRHIIAWLATTNGLARENDAVVRLSLLPNFDGNSSTRERRENIARITATLYPGNDEEWWGGVAPDRLTTWLTRELDETIEDDMPKEQLAIVARLPPNARVNLLRHLTLRAQRNGEKSKQALANAIRAGDCKGIVAAAKVGAEVGDPIGTIAAEILRQMENNVEVARKISTLINDETVPLRELALVAEEILYRNADSDEERAKYANKLSVRLFGLGYHEEALTVVKEGVAIFRGLAEEQPGEFRPALALSLNNLSGYLSDLGRREEALAAATKAVDILNELAKDQPDEFRPALARSFNTLGGCLLGLDRREEALAAAKKAVAILRELADARPDTFRPDLAMSLTNLVSFLVRLEHFEKALAAAEEAVAIRRGLAEARPSTFRPDLAMSLISLSGVLSHPHFKHFEKALAAAEEAVAICRSLAEVRDVFRPDLAASLTNLGNCLFFLECFEKALAAAEEAVAIRRSLAEIRDVFRPDLADSLIGLGNFLRLLGRKEALAAAEEAVAIHRELEKKRPGEFLPDLERSCKFLSDCLSDFGRHV